MTEHNQEKIKCKHCGEPPCEYREVWSSGISFGADILGKPSEEPYPNHGYPIHVLALCRGCGYSWKLPGITQITGVRDIFNSLGETND